MAAVAKARPPWRGPPGRPSSSPYASPLPRFRWGPAKRAARLADLLDILAAEVNAKAIEVAGSDHELVRLKGKSGIPKPGKRYGKDTPRAAAAVSQLTRERWKHWNV